jgi:hypothetical protein
MLYSSTPQLGRIGRSGNDPAFAHPTLAESLNFLLTALEL